jgi:uncharacterized repeat protein (TIGR03803 family)
VQARDGNFYGTTTHDGTYQQGTIFRMTPAGVVTTLVRFDGTNNGINPQGGLMQATDGFLYGTTFGNGAGNLMNQYGTVFRLSTNGSLITLAAFDYTNSGANPNSTLVQGPDAKLYGTTSTALNGAGTIFTCTTNGTLGAIYTFAPDSNNAYVHGGAPNGLTSGADGLFYGTTYYGTDTNTYNNNAGTAFKVTTTGALTTLCYFDDPFSTGGGAGPAGTLLLALDGNFYGTTTMGGSVPANSGTVFRLTPGGVLTDIGVFAGTNGGSPQAGLIQTADGIMYGTTVAGGSSGVGTVFQVTTNGVITLVAQFMEASQTNGTTGTTIAGKYPSAPLVAGQDGSLYGTTSGEVGFTHGTLFRINLPQTGQIYSITYTDLAVGTTNDLTKAGTLDWVKWGNGESNPSPYTVPRKGGGTIINTSLTPLGSVPAGQTVVLVPFGPVTGVTPVFIWTNGTAPMSGGSPVGTSVSQTIAPAQFSYPLGLGLSFQVAADAAPRLLNVYVAAFNTRMKCSVSLSGGGSTSLIASPAALIPVSTGSGSNWVSFGIFSIVYTGAGQTLMLNLTADNQVGIPANAPQFGFANAGSFAATVSVGQVQIANPIILTRPTKLSGGAFQFSFSNTPGLNFSVFGSTNVSLSFSNWSLLGQATQVSSGQFQFTDPQGASQSQRFYRVRYP